MKTTLTHLIALLMSASMFAQGPNWVIKNETNSQIPEDFVTSVRVEANGAAWVGTFENGVAVFDGTDWTLYNTGNSALQDNAIEFICIDNENTKWVGTQSKGLFAITSEPSSNQIEIKDHGKPGDYISTEKSEDANHMTDMSIDNNNMKWISTWGGGLIRYDGSNYVAYTVDNSDLPINALYSVKTDQNNIVWAGTLNRGLVSFDGTNWTIMDTLNSDIPGNTVYSINVDAENNLWVGTDKGLGKFNGTDWEIFDGSTTGWYYNVVNDIVITDNGEKWIATDKGVGVYNDTNWRYIKVSNSQLPNNMVASIALDNRGNQWFGTLGGGLAIYNESGTILSDGWEPEYSDPVDDHAVVVSNYPNPARKGEPTTVVFELTEPRNIHIEVYDFYGRRVSQTMSITGHTGVNQVPVNTRHLSRGDYIIKLSDGLFVDTTTMQIK